MIKWNVETNLLDVISFLKMTLFEVSCQKNLGLLTTENMSITSFIFLMYLRKMPYIFRTETRAFIWAIDKLFGIQREMFMQKWMYAGPNNVYSCLTLRIGHTTILQYQFAHSINNFRNNNWLWTTFTRFALERSTTLIWIRLNSPYHGSDPDI